MTRFVALLDACVLYPNYLRFKPIESNVSLGNC